MDHGSLILGELRQFAKETSRRLDELESKSDSYLVFKAKVMGMAVFAGFMTSVLTSGLLVFVEWVKK